MMRGAYVSAYCVRARAGCKVFVGACSESVFVRNCADSTFYLACKQLRTRDCKNCTFYLYCQTEPIIETSEGMAFAPFAPSPRALHH